MSHYLPEEILIEIFIRLPWKSLMQLRYVSKSVCALILTRSFINSHYYFSNAKNNISILSADTVSKRMFSIDYNSISSLLPMLSSSSSTMLECDEFTEWVDYPSLSEDCVIEFLGSCNGLVCICCSRYSVSSCQSFGNGICHHRNCGHCCHGHEIYLWNPSTKEYKKLPTLPQRPDDFVDFDLYGFGYDYKFDDYKLLMFIDDEDDDVSVDLDVYSLKSNSWRTIQNIPYSVSKTYPEGVVVNGALHWFATTKDQDFEVLISFDVVNEIFAEVPLPEVEPSEDVGPRNLDVAVLGGCLCLLFHVFNVRADVWVMQDYGVKESWTKSFTITQETIIGNRYLMLVWSFKNDEILVQAGGKLSLYDPNNNTHIELKFHKSAKKQRVVDKYVASMVSLK